MQYQYADAACHALPLKKVGHRANGAPFLKIRVDTPDFADASNRRKARGSDDDPWSPVVRLHVTQNASVILAPIGGRV